MKNRTLITVSCPVCQMIRSVRKDGVGKLCRKCQARRNHLIRKPKDMVGEKSGKLLVISFAFIKKHAYWNCKCECGNECIVSGSKIRNKKAVSCGCVSHSQKGLSRTRAYKSWIAMKQRCYKKTAPHYPRYGGSGITVCQEWRDSFLVFFKDMGERPIGKTLDRINPFGIYSKENCRWATPSEQALNKKTQNHLIEYKNEKKPLTTWATQFGIAWSTFRARIMRHKWSIEKALNTPVRQKKK